MSKASIAILVFGLLGAAPVWSLTLVPHAKAALGFVLQEARDSTAFDAAVPKAGATTWAIAAMAVPTDACKTGFCAETANCELDGRNLLAACADRRRSPLVVQRLRDASTNNPLPAFMRRVARA